MLAEYRIGICKTQSLRAENRCAEGNMSIQTTDTQPPLFVPTVQTQDVLVHSELQSVQQLNLGHGQKAVKSQFKNIIYFANCSIYSNAKKPKKKPKQKLTCPPLITFYLLHHTVAVFSLAIVSSSWLPSREEHSTPLSSPPIAMTMEGVCLSAGRHSEQCYRTHKEVVTDGFWSDPVKSGL